MKKFRLILFLLTAPILFGNFGMVEYAALHPKTKTIQTDSLVRKHKAVNLYAQESASTEVKAEEEKSTHLSWPAYLLMGMKAIGGFLLNLLAKF